MNVAKEFVLQEAQWALESVWTAWRREKFIYLLRIEAWSLCCCAVCGPIIPTTLVSEFLMQCNLVEFQVSEVCVTKLRSWVSILLHHWMEIVSQNSSFHRILLIKRILMYSCFIGCLNCFFFSLGNIDLSRQFHRYQQRYRLFRMAVFLVHVNIYLSMTRSTLIHSKRWNSSHPCFVIASILW